MAAATLGPALIAAAVVVREQLMTPGIKSLLVAGALLVLGQFVANATARAAHPPERRRP
jgi:hypothetical protein